MTEEQRIERAGRAVSVLIRLLVSALIPLWGLGMLVLGILLRRQPDRPSK
jgi:hypothetical protein